MKSLIPNFILQKISSREGMLKMTKNFSWLFADKIFKLTIVMAVNIWAYRYLGPENVGIWNYAIAFVTIFTPIANMGIDGIVVRDIVTNPKRKNELIGAAFMLKLFGGIALTFLTALAIYIRRPEDSQMLYYIIVISSAHIFLAFDAIDLYNQSQLKSKYTVLSKSIGYTICSGLKVYFILKGLPLEYFIWVQFIENAIGAVFLIYWYQRQNNKINQWKFSLRTSLSLTKQSWPLILTTSLLFVQQYIDQVFIGDWIGEEELGQFSTAAKLIALFGFIPMIIQSTVGPEIANAKKQSEELYLYKFKKLYQIMLLVSVFVIACCFIAGKFAVTLLYGKEYEQAGILMGLMSIRFLFINFSVIKTLYVTNNNIFVYYLLTSLLGASLNIGLNIVLIPHFGSVGAIWASIISFLISIILIDLFYKQARDNFKCMIEAFYDFKAYKNILKD
jgi:O-antigen/teichoic acid export membrane protein